MFDETTTTTTDATVDPTADQESTEQNRNVAPDPFGIGLSYTWTCTGCDYVGEDEGGPLYECGGCGTEFNRDRSYDGCSHQCPKCSKFAARVADYSCPECGMAEVEETESILCPDCGEFVTLDVWEEHWLDEHADDLEAQSR